MASLPKGGVGAEIGVSFGFFSKVLLEVCQPTQLCLIDPWLHQTEEGIRNDPSNAPQQEQDELYRQVCEGIGQSARVRVIRMFSVKAAETFDDEYFDWWHADADHTKVRQDIDAWWPKLKPGGWATGHDYTVAGDCITVKTDVDAWVAENKLELFIAGLDSDDIYERNYPTWAVQKGTRCLNR